MSVDRVQRTVNSLEFTEWMAFYTVEAEMLGGIESEPTPEELGMKLRAFADAQNARHAARKTP